MLPYHLDISGIVSHKITFTAVFSSAIVASYSSHKQNLGEMHEHRCNAWPMLYWQGSIMCVYQNPILKECVCVCMCVQVWLLFLIYNFACIRIQPAFSNFQLQRDFQCANCVYGSSVLTPISEKASPLTSLLQDQGQIVFIFILFF